MIILSMCWVFIIGAFGTTVFYIQLNLYNSVSIYHYYIIDIEKGTTYFLITKLSNYFNKVCTQFFIK